MWTGPLVLFSVVCESALGRALPVLSWVGLPVRGVFEA